LAIWREAIDVEGIRTLLVVPLAKSDRYLGCIMVYRREIRAFTDSQIDLLRTYADQAVIAIQNARLFTELQAKNQALTQAHAQVTEALEQQTATSEILRVISRSPTDLQPVFDTIVESVVQLCDGVSATVYRFDGNLIHLIAHHHSVSSAAREAFERVYPLPPSRTSVVAQAILDRAVIHVRDFEDDPSIPTASREMARAVGHRSLAVVPMRRGEVPIGAISVGRRGPHATARPFSDSEITLLKTFADQAVIAIENVRLFNETKEALEQQTATAEILRVISSSLTDIQPVFDAARRAPRVCASRSTPTSTVETEIASSASLIMARSTAESASSLFHWPAEPLPVGRCWKDGRFTLLTHRRKKANSRTAVRTAGAWGSIRSSSCR
jgi:two-component system NtrC family sensor kinase